MNYELSVRYEKELLQNISLQKEHILKLNDMANNLWIGEDAVYRFYHESFKVYRVQDLTNETFDLIKKLLPLELNKMFLKIVAEGTGKEFSRNEQGSWYENTKPIINAFLHMKHILNMIIKYGLESNDSERDGNMGWFTVLYIYNIR